MTKEEETRHGILRDRFFLKMFAGFSILILLIMLSIIIFSQKAVEKFNISMLKKSLYKIAVALDSKTAEFISNNKIDELDKWIKQKGVLLKSRITIIDQGGKVFADSEKDPAKMENHAGRPEVLEALQGKIGYSMRFSTTVGNHMLYVALPSISGGEIKYVIRLSLYLKDISGFSAKLRNDMLKIILISFFIALLFSWYFTKLFNKPLKDIISATEKFAGGDFSTKLYFKKRSGLENVAKGFNSMVERQEIVFSELDDKKSQLDAIISSMEESLLVINRDGKILLTNNSFNKMFNITDNTKTFYWEMLRFPDIEKLIKKGFSMEEVTVHEENFNGKYYLITLSKIKNSNKLVITFKDITTFKNLETMKREFLLNLTHEFKTPLTAIKGFVETLNEEEDIKNKKYIDIINRHTDRMTQLVSDLLTLSELEEGVKNLKFEKLSISEILKNVIRIFKEKIENKGLKLIVSIDKKTPDIMGEKFKLEQMFINLIDNAMKYTDKGTIEIEMKYSIEKNEILFNISNSGSLIPEESIPRIFERFYVVDKSRSKKVGGTGLGLSIVKHVVLIHKGEISVRNRKSAGTQFLIKFPV